MPGEGVFKPGAGSSRGKDDAQLIPFEFGFLEDDFRNLVEEGIHVTNVVTGLDLSEEKMKGLAPSLLSKIHFFSLIRIRASEEWKRLCDT